MKLKPGTKRYAQRQAATLTRRLGTKFSAYRYNGFWLVTKGYVVC